MTLLASGPEGGGRLAFGLPAAPADGAPFGTGRPPGGAVLLEYAGLRAWDAKGRELTGRIVWEGAPVGSLPGAGWPGGGRLDPAGTHTVARSPAPGSAASGIGTAGTFRLEIDDAGAAYPVRIDPLASTPSSSWWCGQGSVHMFGASMAVGDVNGDGFADVMLGARQYNNTYASSGMVWVLHGGAGEWNITPAEEETVAFH